MTSFAGIYFHTEFNNALISQINQFFDKNAGKQRKNFLHNNLYLMYADLGCYHQNAYLQTSSHIAMLTGHPLLTSNRSEDLNTLTNSDELPKVLSECEGAFCYAHYDCQSTVLTLATDPLGLRPYYVYQTPEFTLFSTQLSLFKSLKLPLTSNKEGLIEYATLGYYLFDHTPYNEVRCASPGEIFSLSSKSQHTTTYFDWHKLAATSQTLTEAVDGITADFREATSKYLNQDKQVLMTLSGGLDSRVIACELKRQGCQVKALNFSQAETQDLYCAKSLAEDIEVDLEVVKVPDTQAKSVEQRLGDYWQRHPRRQNTSIERPCISWSGNGGSVGIGVIYYDDTVYKAACSQDVEALVDAYLDQQYAYVPKSLVNDAQDLQAKLRSNLCRSLQQFEGLPLEKAYLLFLLLNDQHHHLAIPFEDIYDYQMEFALPMYSWKVLRHTLSLPVELTRKHHFYMEWLKASYPEALNTPWQSYPGHIPCPIKPEGMDQWQIKRSNNLGFSQLYRTALQGVFYKRHNLIKGHNLLLLCLLHQIKLKDSFSQVKLAQKLTTW